MPKSLYTVYIFAKLATRRFFRDRLALFFGILFPVIFLFVFGAFSSNTNNTHFNVALINQSHTKLAAVAEKMIKDSKTLKVDPTIKTPSQADTKLSQNQLDGLIILPPGFRIASQWQDPRHGRGLLYN